MYVKFPKILAQLSLKTMQTYISVSSLKTF